MRELSLHILDIAENSLRSKASLIEIIIEENTKDNLYKIIVKDNGKGMTQSQVNQVMDPFVTERKTRKIGLGLPLFAATAKRTNGDINLSSCLNKGTKLIVRMERNNIDLPPLGKIDETISSLIYSNTGCEILYIHKLDDIFYKVDTREIKKTLESVPLNDPIIIKWLKNYIKENEIYLRQKGALA